MLNVKKLLFAPSLYIIRLCANTGTDLHLVKPLSFTLEDKQLKRAGLDYHEYANLKVHKNWADCKVALAGKRLFAITTKSSTRHSDIQFKQVIALCLAQKLAVYRKKYVRNLRQNTIYVCRCYRIAVV